MAKFSLPGRFAESHFFHGTFVKRYNILPKIIKDAALTLFFCTGNALQCTLAIYHICTPVFTATS